MFTKGNMAVGEMNGGSTLSTMLKTGSLTIYGRWKTDDGKQRVEDKRRMLDAKG